MELESAGVQKFAVKENAREGGERERERKSFVNSAEYSAEYSNGDKVEC